METFLQGMALNYFTCHSAADGLPVSHMYNAFKQKHAK